MGCGASKPPADKPPAAGRSGAVDRLLIDAVMVRFGTEGQDPHGAVTPGQAFRRGLTCPTFSPPSLLPTSSATRRRTQPR